jgi:hypothetical protein
MERRAIREPKFLRRNFMRTTRLTESRRRMGTELGVRFRRRVSVNEQGRRRQRFPSQLTLTGVGVEKVSTNQLIFVRSVWQYGMCSSIV